MSQAGSQPYWCHSYQNEVEFMFQSCIQHSDAIFDVILVAAAFAIVTSHVSQNIGEAS
jgi:hypothetical protein